MNNQQPERQDRILVLIMSAKKPFFQRQVKQILQTWYSDADRPRNIDVMYYDGNNPRQGLDEADPRHLMCRAGDGLDYTYLKTYEAIEQVMRMTHKQYDWVLRINTSTWVNLHLLRKFVDSGTCYPDALYCSELYSLTEAPCPEPLNLYGRGNALLLSRSMCNRLLTYGVNLLYLKVVDDVAIGNVLNTYFNQQSNNPEAYMYHIKCWPHGWYRCIDDPTIPNGHQLCKYGEDPDKEWAKQFYANFMTVQTKKYRQREEEDRNMQDFYNIMKGLKADNVSTTVLETYMRNPDVFLGSAIGYVKLNVWKILDKQQLYMFEMNHKAIDDQQNPNCNQKAFEKLHKVPET